MSVAVIQPFFNEDITKTRLRATECLALGYLTASLRAHDIDATGFDGHLLQIENEGLIELLEDRNDSVVGISCSAERMYYVALDLARMIKERLPGVHVTLGGQFATQLHDRIAAQAPAFDSIVRGEGELIFPRLIERVESGESMDGLPGVTYRVGDEVFINADPERIQDLDALPFPDRHTLPITVEEVRAGVRSVSMLATRGCIYKCTFCSVDRPRFARSAKNVVAEMKALVEQYGVRKFEFNDDLLIGASAEMQRWAHELADELLTEMPDHDLDLWAMTRSDAVNKALFEKLHAAGFNTIFIGIESGSDGVLKRLKKGTRAHQNDRAIATLKEVGIRPGYGFIILEPDITWKELGENLAFLRRTGYFTQHSFTNKMNIYAGAPLYERFREDQEAEGGDDDYARLDVAVSRPKYIFKDENIRRYNDVLVNLKRDCFWAKEQMVDLLTRLRELRVDIRDVASTSQIETWDRQILADMQLLEDLYALAWLEMSEMMYAEIDRGNYERVDEEVREFGRIKLAPFADVLAEIRQRADGIAELSGGPVETRVRLRKQPPEFAALVVTQATDGDS